MAATPARAPTPKPRPHAPPSATQLFFHAPPERLRFSSFGHIVPPDNLLPVVVGTGPRGSNMQFSFGSRSAEALIDALGELLLSLAQTVPDGIVVFVPSFQYEAQVVGRWQASATWHRLAQLKSVFREPRSAGEADKVLKDYAAAIETNCGPTSGVRGVGTSVARASQPGAGASHEGAPPAPRGAILLSVVGGKMSEGINFSDGLGRCVLMVGMPYASPHDLELQERMAYLDRSQEKGAGREYYMNLCMKAVNQSIGRAIRHKGDYATIVLADQRYAKASVRRRLPQWIADRLVAPASCAEALRTVRGFFDRWSADQEQRFAQRAAAAMQ